jgi:hypothetical protein
MLLVCLRWEGGEEEEEKTKNEGKGKSRMMRTFMEFYFSSLFSFLFYLINFFFDLQIFLVK